MERGCDRACRFDADRYGQRLKSVAALLAIGLPLLVAARGNAQVVPAGPAAPNHTGEAPAGQFTREPAPLPPSSSKGFVPTSPSVTPGQTMVPPPQRARGGVIDPPTAVDPGIGQPTPPAKLFPTPVVKPPQSPP